MAFEIVDQEEEQIESNNLGCQFGKAIEYLVIKLDRNASAFN